MGWKYWIMTDNIDWLISVDSLIPAYLTRWFDLFNYNPEERKHCGRTWLVRAQRFLDFVRFRLHTYTRTQQSLTFLWTTKNWNRYLDSSRSSGYKTQGYTFLGAFYLYFFIFIFYLSILPFKKCLNICGYLGNYNHWLYVRFSISLYY